MKMRDFFWHTDVDFQATRYRQCAFILQSVTNSITFDVIGCRVNKLNANASHGTDIILFLPGDAGDNYA